MDEKAGSHLRGRDIPPIVSDSYPFAIASVSLLSVETRRLGTCALRKLSTAYAHICGHTSVED